MPKQSRDTEQHNEQLQEHASRASALLAARARNVKGNSNGPSNRASAPAASNYPRNHQTRRQPQSRTAKGRQNKLVAFAKRNAVYIAGVTAVVLVVALGMVILGVARPFNLGVDSGTGEKPAYENPFDWTKLDRSDGRYRYLVDGQVKSRLGIDVSENQHEIDWEAVANDGIEFAIVRLGYRGSTEGELHLDEQYRTNLEGARRAGLDIGVYFFSQARTVEESVEEADFVLEQLGGAHLEYPIAFDSEEVALGVNTPRTSDLTKSEMTAIAEAFCKRIEDAGYQSTIYGNALDLARYDYDVLKSNSIWWAEYDTPVPTASIGISYWQYSNSGSVAGISTAVDMDLDLTHAL